MFLEIGFHGVVVSPSLKFEILAVRSKFWGDATVEKLISVPSFLMASLVE